MIPEAHNLVERPGSRVCVYILVLQRGVRRLELRVVGATLPLCRGGRCQRALGLGLRRARYGQLGANTLQLFDALAGFALNTEI